MLKMLLDIQLFAHVKAQGSTHNGRDSAGRRLGAKAADGEFIKFLKYLLLISLPKLSSPFSPEIIIL